MERISDLFRISCRRFCCHRYALHFEWQPNCELRFFGGTCSRFVTFSSRFALIHHPQTCDPARRPNRCRVAWSTNSKRRWCVMPVLAGDGEVPQDRCRRKNKANFPNLSLTKTSTATEPSSSLEYHQQHLRTSTSLRSQPCHNHGFQHQHGQWSSANYLSGRHQGAGRQDRRQHHSRSHHAP